MTTSDRMGLVATVAGIFLRASLMFAALGLLAYALGWWA